MTVCIALYLSRLKKVLLRSKQKVNGTEGGEDQVAAPK